MASRAAPAPASQAPPFVRHHGWWIGDLRTTEASSPALTLEHTCPPLPALATTPRNLHAAASVVHSTRVPRSLLLLNMAEAASVAPGAPTAEKVETLWRPTGRACSPLIVPEATAGAAGARAVLEVLADGGRRHLALSQTRSHGGVSTCPERNKAASATCGMKTSATGGVKRARGAMPQSSMIGLGARPRSSSDGELRALHRRPHGGHGAGKGPARERFPRKGAPAMTGREQGLRAQGIAKGRGGAAGGRRLTAGVAQRRGCSEPASLRAQTCRALRAGTDH